MIAVPWASEAPAWLVGDVAKAPRFGLLSDWCIIIIFSSGLSVAGTRNEII